MSGIASRRSNAAWLDEYRSAGAETAVGVGINGRAVGWAINALAWIVPTQALAASPVPGAAPGQTVVQPEPVSASALALAARAGSLRLFGPNATRAPAQNFSAAERAASAAMFDNLNAADAAMLTAFLKQSSQYVDAQGTRGVTGWWNPLADAWVIGEWRLTGSEWVLESLEPLLGEDLSSNEPGPPISGASFDPRWPSARVSVKAALLQHHLVAVASFKNAYLSGHLVALTADHERTRRARIVMFAREARMRQGLAQAAAQQGVEVYTAAISAVLKPTATIDASQSVEVRRLVALPSEIRGSMEPVMAFRRPTGMTFALQSLFAPGLIVFIHFEHASPNAVSKPPEIELVSLFSRQAL